MGLLDLFSSESSSTNETTNVTTTTESTQATADNRSSDGGNIGGNVNVGQASGDVTVVTTDYGAIEGAERVNLAALDFGSDALETVAGNSQMAIQEVSDQFKFWNQMTAQNVDRSLAFASEANRSEGADILKTGLNSFTWIAIGIGGLLLLRERDS